MPRLTYPDGPEDQPGSLEARIASLLRNVEVDPANLEVRQRLMECVAQKGDWTVYVYQALDCAELEAMAGRQRESVAYYERILGLEDRVVLGPSCRVDSVMQVRQLVATVKPEIYLRIGEYHLEGERLDLAEDFLRRSARLKPGIWDTELALGKCLLALGRGGEAATAFREAIRLVAEDSREEVGRIEEWLARCS